MTGLHRTAALIDRLHKHFPVQTDCLYCMNTIYNSVPISLHNKLDFRKPGNYRLQFTFETGVETTALLDYYQSRLNGGKHLDETPAFPFADYTAAFENRKVE